MPKRTYIVSGVDQDGNKVQETSTILEYTDPDAGERKTTFLTPRPIVVADKPKPVIKTRGNAAKGTIE